MSGVSPCGVPGTWLRKELLRDGGLLGLGTGAGIGLISLVWMGADVSVRVEKAAGRAVPPVVQSSDWKVVPISYYYSHYRLCHWRMSDSTALRASRQGSMFLWVPSW